MNCECVYYDKNATRENLENLAKRIKDKGTRCEIYPCAISKVTEETYCTRDYDGYAEEEFIPENSEVLFVGGKLHYMTPTKVDGILYKPLFPQVTHQFFEDIIEF